MSSDTSIILVFEPTVILQGREKEWQLYKNLGNCYLPEVVSEELEFLTKRSVLPEEEKIAREFIRFFPNSRWQIHHGMTSHQSWIAFGGESMSKNARLQNAIAQSVYDLTINNPEALVVLVSNKQNLRQDLEKIKKNNFASLTLAQFNQWLRTKQKPTIITNKLSQLMGNSDSDKTGVKSSNAQKNVNKLSKTNPNQVRPSSGKRQKSTPTNIFSTITSAILTLGAIAFVGFLSWYWLEPESFQEFWENNRSSMNNF